MGISDELKNMKKKLADQLTSAKEGLKEINSTVISIIETVGVEDCFNVASERFTALLSMMISEGDLDNLADAKDKSEKVRANYSKVKKIASDKIKELMKPKENETKASEETGKYKITKYKTVRYSPDATLLIKYYMDMRKDLQEIKEIIANNLKSGKKVKVSDVLDLLDAFENEFCVNVDTLASQEKEASLNDILPKRIFKKTEFWSTKQTKV